MFFFSDILGVVCNVNIKFNTIWDSQKIWKFWNNLLWSNLIRCVILHHNTDFYPILWITTSALMHVLISLIINTKWRQSRTTKDSSSHQRYTHHKEKCICCIWIIKSLQIIFSVIKRCAHQQPYTGTALPSSIRNTRWKYKPMIPICIYSFVVVLMI